MTILNKDNFVNIISWGKEHNHNPITVNPIIDQGNHRHYFHLRNWNDKDYWYVEFLHGDAFFWHPISKLTDPETFSKIQQGDITLVLCNNQEAYHCIIDEIYKYVVIADNIPPKNILLLTNSFDITKEIDYVSQLYEQDKIKAAFILEFVYMAKIVANCSLQDTFSVTKNALNKKEYDKKFLSFNGFDRIHRVALVNLFNIHNMLSLGHISYNTNMNGAKHFSGDHYYKSLKTIFPHESRLIKDIESNKEKVFSLGPIWLDTNLETARNMADYSSTDATYYEETYFSVVTETLCVLTQSQDGFVGIGRELSEKTFKAIVNKHPFILLTVPNSLEVLKRFGFKTFHPYINEDYDKELDDAERIYMVFEETRRLCNLSASELDEFIYNCKKIARFNFLRLKTFSNFFHLLN